MSTIANQSHNLPYFINNLQRKYLDFIREYIFKNESSPRLEEIANHFGVRAPTVHKILDALQSKRYLYFGRDNKSGFFIRLIERAGSTEVIIEVPIARRVGTLGEVFDFPEKLGHFASIFVGAKPDDVFALVVTENIHQANIIAGDPIIFDIHKKSQPDDICIGPARKRLQIASKIMDREMHTFETAMPYPIWGTCLAQSSASYSTGIHCLTIMGPLNGSLRLQRSKTGLSPL